MGMNTASDWTQDLVNDHTTWRWFARIEQRHAAIGSVVPSWGRKSTYDLRMLKLRSVASDEAIFCK